MPLVNGVPTLVAPSRPGLALNYDATAAAMTAAFQAGLSEAEMVVVIRQPGITEADVSNIQTPYLLGRGSTSFGGSASGRAHNVRFGAGLVDGELIPPGAIFSLNEALGLGLPGNGTLLATHARRWELFEAASRRIVEMANAHYVDGDLAVVVTLVAGAQQLAVFRSFERALETLDIAAADAR